ncbi:MAG TPA: alpha/beta fold hydrolase [Streptosporangiaceae bacterium]
MSHDQAVFPGRPHTVPVTGAVLVAHGGRSQSTAPVTAYQPAVLRMIPVTGAIRRALPGRATVVNRPMYQLRGWNGDLASPVADLTGALDQLGERFGPIPVVLIGHSMGARAAMRVAGHPQVTAVAGLAPWLPPGEPVQQLAGRRVLLAQAAGDRITRPAETWAFAERAAAVTTVATIEVAHSDHAMLRRAPLWHKIATGFVRLALGLSADEEPVAAAFRAAGAGGPHLRV